MSNLSFCDFVSTHSRLHPPTDSVPAGRNRTDCPLPEGIGYQEGIPGFAGRQAGISQKGEGSDHKGIFGKSIKIRFFKRRHILRLAPAEDFGGKAGMFRLRLYRRWIDKADGSLLFYSPERLVELVVAMSFDDNAALSALPATYPDLRNGGSYTHAAVLTHCADLRNKICGTISVCRDCGTHLKLEIAHAEHFRGIDGMYRARFQQRWISDPDGSPRFLSRDELAELIASLILNDAPILPAAYTSTAVRKRRYAVSAHSRDANKKGAACVLRAGAKNIRTAKPKPSANKKRLARSHTEEKYNKKSWSLAVCPYAAGTMRIEGDRMPDPAWGF
jgi:hypothetical protein